MTTNDPDHIEADHIEDVIRSVVWRAIRPLTVAVILCMLLSIGVAAFAWIDSGNKADTIEANQAASTKALAAATQKATAELAAAMAKTNKALCAFRGDIAARVAQGKAFLREHPEGFAGIPAAQLRQTIDGQQRTVDSLAGLDCVGPGP